MATNNAEQEVVADMGSTNGLHWLNVGTQEQPVLQKKGDNIRIDWGYAYLAVPQSADAQLSPGPLTTLKTSFLERGTLPAGKQLPRYGAGLRHGGVPYRWVR